MDSMLFKNKISNNVITSIMRFGDLDEVQRERLSRIMRAWNFYEGYHWEDIPETDKPQITENYCRAFVNKFVSFELGKGFTINPHKNLAEVSIDGKNNTTASFLEEVWKGNEKGVVCTEVGQSKSVTGEGWIQVKFIPPEDLVDPYEEYPKGKIRIIPLSTHVVFPMYDEHDKDNLIGVTIQYPIEVDERNLIQRLLHMRSRLKTKLYKQVWTAKQVVTSIDDIEQETLPNMYGIIPFVQIKNYPIAGKSEGVSDLEDLIPLNTELNLKKSDISEIIDYHAAPVTVVYGAKIASLEKGANKLWGGLPKDGKVENLELKGDLAASVSYVTDLKTAMHEVGGIPEGSLGGDQHISNTSGVALQFANMPIIERVNVKRMCSKAGFEKVNKLILLVAVIEDIIKIPEGIKKPEFYYNEVDFPDTLPKDTIIELQAIQSEMSMGLEDRPGAMKRLGKTDVKTKLAEIDKDREEHPEIYTPDLMKNAEGGIKQINSGVSNGSTPIEQLRKEANGANK
jgi:hypothetical protein